MNTRGRGIRRAATRGLLALALGVGGAASAPTAGSATGIGWTSWQDPNTWFASPEIHTYGYTQSMDYSGQSGKYCSKLTLPYVYSYEYMRRCYSGWYSWAYSDEWGLAPRPNNSVSMRAHAANGDNPQIRRISLYAEY